jgi:hypothetical protein
MHIDYLGWAVDLTGPQMILTIRLMAFAFNLYDGGVMAPTLVPISSLMHEVLVTS